MLPTPLLYASLLSAWSLFFLWLTFAILLASAQTNLVFFCHHSPAFISVCGVSWKLTPLRVIMHHVPFIPSFLGRNYLGAKYLEDRL